MSENMKSEYPPAYDNDINSCSPPERNDSRANDHAYYGYQEESVGMVPRQFYCPTCNRFN